MSTQRTSIKKSSTPTIGAIKSALKIVSAKERDGIISVENDGNKENDGTVAKSQAQTAQKFAYNHTNSLAFKRAFGFKNNYQGQGYISSGTSSSLKSSNIDWSKFGAEASSLSSQDFFGNNGNGGPKVGGIATLNDSDLQLLEGGQGDGNFSVINSTVSSKVSWMTSNGGNYLTQYLRNRTNEGASIGEIFNSTHGKHVGGRSQTLNVNGNKVDNNFGKEGNRASHAIFLADLRHGRHGSWFAKDFQNFRQMALANGVPADKIQVYDTWDAYKKAITAAAQEAKAIRAQNPNAELGLLTGTAAHGYSYGGRGVHDPNAISGFSVAGQDVKEHTIENLIGKADAFFNNTIMINCPCHSGGFDGKTDLLAKGLMDNDPQNDVG